MINAAGWALLRPTGLRDTTETKTAQHPIRCLIRFGSCFPHRRSPFIILCSPSSA